MMFLLLVLIIPITVWTLSYTYLALYYKKIDIFNVKIHETGRYTLVETIFYCNHFLRELFIDSIFVLCIYISYRVLLPKEVFTLETFSLGQIIYFSKILLFLFLSLVFLCSIRKVGVKNTFLDLFQYRELDTVIEYGSHWKMHFLSTLYLILMFALPATFVKGQERGTLIGVFILFFIVSALFGLSKNMISNKKWLMHGGREIITFFFIGFLPFYLPLLVLFNQNISLNITILTTVFIITLLIISFYLLKIFFSNDVVGMTEGKFDFIYLIASHFFEHTLDFIYMILLMLVLTSVVV